MKIQSKRQVGLLCIRCATMIHYCKILLILQSLFICMGGGKTPCFIGRQKYKADQQKTKQRTANKKKSTKVYDKISAALASPDSKLLTKNQRKDPTKLCAQTSSPAGSEVSRLNPKVLSDKFVEAKSPKVPSDKDDKSDLLQMKMLKDLSMPETRCCLQRWQQRRPLHRWRTIG